MNIGLCQMDIEWQDKELNKLKCHKFIKEAKEKQVDLLIFPEMTLTGFSMNAELISEDTSLESETLSWFRSKALEFRINIGFGMVQKKSSLYYNNLCIISRDGSLLSSYSKIHPFSYGEEAKYYTGGENFITTTLENINIGSTICYDLRFPELFQILSCNSDAIIVIANWPEVRREHWITLLKARAIENQCYILGVNRVGLGNNIKYAGDSMIVSPLGEVLCHLSSYEGLIYSNILKEEVENIRSKFPLKKDRKEHLYIQGYELNKKGDNL